ncbi:TIGD6 [Cordylochernes scorpioides]|uniref:TIGD6 n=1 Tax=Cordylochernes scorpioides TaxID=51811 RepID=A0ABY6LGS0_9ARAC|nr:TIGD6 [Cordylochernes scorpioides]
MKILRYLHTSLSQQQQCSLSWVCKAAVLAPCPFFCKATAIAGSTLKRDRDGEFPEIEEALFRWIRQANAMKLAINGNILKEKAILLALKMGQDNFEASNGWLERFKARRNIAFKRLHGEAGSVDANSVATWKGGIIPSLLAKYSPPDIFNADETGLFYKLLPNQTMTIRGEKCEGGKKSKERITVLVCCNMDGSEKLPLLYIGKYRRPRCFHGMNIPSNYHFNKKAWMTGAIFTDWLKKLDQIFKRRERKIFDNCPAHQIPEGLQNIEIRFLPALTTSALQPCDMGIIKALKDQYRKRMITYLLTCMEEKKCSRFVMDEAMEEVVEEEMNRCFEALKNIKPLMVNYIDFLEVDKDVQVAGEQSIEEIVKEVMGKEEDEEVEPTEKDLNKTSITPAAAVDAFNTIKLFVI